jgi:AraC family transcriptional regulator of adaptative response/methylated-DNA-[protein]-cysteine methyltransferase
VLQRIAGDPAPADIPLDITGTAFQRRVWEALRHIPYGEVRTYGEIAIAIGVPKAVRAVGTACGSNPVAIVVPCHRVVPKSGGVGNYGFGPDRKRVLLAREGAAVEKG